MGSFKKIAKNLLIENFWDRKFGEPLPTLNDVAEKHQIEKKEPVNEGKKAVKAYKEMNSAVTTAIYGVKNFRKLIDDAPYVPVLAGISQELYRFEIDLEKKLRKLLPQMKKYSTGNKFMESVDKHSLRETFERIGGK